MVHNCCVPLCVAHSSRYKGLSWHTIPKGLKEKWGVLVRNDNLPKQPRVCGLHFVKNFKRQYNEDPSIFPWTSKWKEQVDKYNAMMDAAAAITMLSGDSTQLRPPVMPAKRPATESSLKKSPKKRRPIEKHIFSTPKRQKTVGALTVFWFYSNTLIINTLQMCMTVIVMCAKRKPRDQLMLHACICVV